GVKPMAMDEAPWGGGSDFGGLVDSQFGEGMHWLGFPYLAELSQRAEYRSIVETVARDMTRKWLRIQAAGGADKSEKIRVINAEMDRHKVRDKFRRLAELDGFFGRGHLYIDTGVSMDDRDGLKSTLIMDRRTFPEEGLKYLQVVEPTWTYPGMYNSINPLRRDFYIPETWYVMAREIHRTRLLTVIGRSVPDLLKPAYSFGGISMSQLAKPYVDNWLRTRQSISDLIHSFSTMVLATDLSSMLQDGTSDQLDVRAQVYNKYRDNNGLFVISKETEEFSNVSTALGTLDHLQAQSQEHMAAVSHIPLVVLTGITPSGLNATSEGELQIWGQTIKAMQEHLFNDPFMTVLQAIQLDKFGEIDPEITHAWEPLKEESAEEEATRRNNEATAHKTYVEMGAIGPDEVRQALAQDEDSPYAGLDLSGPPPTPPQMEGDPLGTGAPGAAPETGNDGGLVDQVAKAFADLAAENAG